jgi:hypothetical protein
VSNSNTQFYKAFKDRWITYNGSPPLPEMDYSSRNDMEVPGLVFAVFGAFHNVTTDILLLNAIKDSKDSIQSNIVMLANAQLQLTNWGGRVGINVEDPSNIDYTKLVPKEHQAQAQKTLESMKTALGKAHMRKRNLFQLNEEVSTAPINEDKISNVVQKLRNLSVSRFKKLDNVRKRTKWVVYDKEIVIELLCVVHLHMEDLEKLIPGDAKVKETLDRQDVKVGRANLEEVRKLCDEWREEQKRADEAAKSEGQAAKSTGDTFHTSFTDTKDSVVQAGRDSNVSELHINKGQ